MWCNRQFYILQYFFHFLISIDYLCTLYLYITNFETIAIAHIPESPWRKRPREYWPRESSFEWNFTCLQCSSVFLSSRLEALKQIFTKCVFAIFASFLIYTNMTPITCFRLFFIGITSFYLVQKFLFLRIDRDTVMEAPSWLGNVLDAEIRKKDCKQIQEIK